MGVLPFPIESCPGRHLSALGPFDLGSAGASNLPQITVPLEPLLSMTVGGRLLPFSQAWETLTQDKWILGVVKEGLSLEFATGVL